MRDWWCEFTQTFFVSFIFFPASQLVSYFEGILMSDIRCSMIELRTGIAAGMGAVACEGGGQCEAGGGG